MNNKLAILKNISKIVLIIFDKVALYLIVGLLTLRSFMHSCTETIIVGYQNNYVGNSSTMSNAAKNFNILAINLSVLYNYFDSSTIIFKLVSS